jgi:hypothetical protein
VAGPRKSKIPGIYLKAADVYSPETSEEKI